MSFYQRWLETSESVEKRVTHSPVVARGKDLQWIETPQDARVAMIIGEESGFPTMGTSLTKAEIPAGWHTGKHRHGEEGMYILQGTGFSIVDGRRYDWKPGTTLFMPFMSEHQHFNTGAEPVLYLSAMSLDLDLYVKLGRLQQIEEKGPNPPDLAQKVPDQDSQFAPDGGRIALHAEDAIDENARRAAAAGHHGHGHQGHRHAGIWILMGGSESQSDETNGFRAKSVAVTNIFEETAHTRSHSHTHTEAMLYVLEGSGYSEIDGQRYDWQEGDAVHVPPKMTRHEHFNDSDARTRTLRIEFGIRYFYEELWTGFHKVEHRLTAEALQPA